MVLSSGKQEWDQKCPGLPYSCSAMNLVAHPVGLTGPRAQFLVAPQQESMIDSYGIDLIHPIRQGAVLLRSARKAKVSIAGLLGSNSAG